MNLRKKIKWKILSLSVSAALLLVLALTAFATQPEKRQPSERAADESKAAPGAGDEALQNTEGAAGPRTASQSKSSLARDKNETVYVKADAKGAVREITVEAALRREEGGSEIRDVADLTDIRNTKGEEECRLEADHVVLWENQGEDIYYKGKSSARLPVEVRISYTLNGTKVSPEQLAGQSGRVTIRFDYENHSMEKVKVEKDGGEREETQAPVPFAALSVVVLPEEVFSNIEIENGKLMAMDGQSMAVGYAYPELAEYLKLTEYEPTEEIEIPDYLEITADVEGFELAFTATVVTAGTLEDLDTEDLDDVQEWIDSMEDLTDASTELTKGTAELLEGVEEFRDYLKEYTDGATKLKDGAKALRDGIGTLNEKKSDLANGAKALENGLEGLNAALGSMALSGGGAASVPDAEQQAQLEAMLLEKVKEQYPDLPPEEQAAMAAWVQGVAAELAAQQFSGMGTALEELKDGLRELSEGSRQLSEGIGAFNGGIGQLYDGSAQLYEGTKQLSNAGEELYSGFDEVVDGARSLKEGMEEFDGEGIQELGRLAGPELEELLFRLRAVKEADGSYQSFSGLSEGKTGSMKFFIETEEIE